MLTSTVWPSRDGSRTNISRSVWRSLVSTRLRIWRVSISKPGGTERRTASSTIVFQLSMASWRCQASSAARKSAPDWPGCRTGAGPTSITVGSK